MPRFDYLFEDRRDAGRQLARALDRFRDASKTLILALPRGGVVVGFEMSLALRLPLEVLITRKLGTPGNPELAMGALTETGYRYLNPDVLEAYGISDEDLREEVQRQEQEIERRIKTYRQGRALPPLEGWTVIMVDDGIATGATFYASLAALRHQRVAHLVAAVPVAPERARQELRGHVDDTVILLTPSLFYGIGQFYANFTQVTDEEVLSYLGEARNALAQSSSSTRKTAGPDPQT